MVPSFLLAASQAHIAALFLNPNLLPYSSPSSRASLFGLKTLLVRRRLMSLSKPREILIIARSYPVKVWSHVQLGPEDANTSPRKEKQELTCILAAFAAAAIVLVPSAEALGHVVDPGYEVSEMHSTTSESSLQEQLGVSTSVATSLGAPSLGPKEDVLTSASKLMNLGDSVKCNAAPLLESPAEDAGTGEVTNESIVEEAWQVVNERFLDARHHNWSPDAWLKKKEEMLKRPVPSRMAAYGIIKSMLSDLNDPYTRFITPRELKQLSKYDMTGIGLSLGEVADENGGTSLRVVGIVLGSPAQMAGIKQGDELLSVDGINVHMKSAFEASSLIQGPKGTLVSIEIRHGPCGESQTLSVDRQQSVRTPVYYRLEHSPSELIGYIRLKEFNALAKRDLVTAMNRLKAAGATSFLLDLQDNPGGLVQAGIEIAKVFLEGGKTVIYTVGKEPALQKSILATGPPLTTAPLMVLVNDHTASASEIVAAALHDNCRAVLVGRRTFGKGLIQSVFELSDGSGVILTVGKYVTPRHQDIDGNGIEPDFKQLPGLIEAKKQLEKCSIT